MGPVGRLPAPGREPGFDPGSDGLAPWNAPPEAGGSLRSRQPGTVLDKNGGRGGLEGGGAERAPARVLPPEEAAQEGREVRAGELKPAPRERPIWPGARS